MIINIRLQKIFYIFCFMLSISMFVYALIFMTDYQVLFGFETLANKEIADFYDNKLQVFNREILSFGIFMIVGFGIMGISKIMSEVCNFFTLIINSIYLILVIVRPLLFVFEIKAMLNTYVNLDFSYTYVEGLENYQINTRMLDFGIILNYLIIIGSLVFLAILIINFFRYLSLNEGVKTYFKNLKKKVFSKPERKNER
ncbi:MAG: hypothetical protein PHX62_09610 [Bacilli bacterium]|nr:hypothetical protein [Bacilli bacterium]